MLTLSVIGLVYRIARLCVPFLSKAILLRKNFGSHLEPIKMTSGDSFVLEIVLDNLIMKPKLRTMVVEEIAVMMRKIEYQRYYCHDHDDGCVGDRTPLLNKPKEDEAEGFLVSKSNKEKTTYIPRFAPEPSTRYVQDPGTDVDMRPRANSTLKGSRDPLVETSAESKPPNYSFIEAQNEINKLGQEADVPKNVALRRPHVAQGQNHVDPEAEAVRQQTNDLINHIDDIPPWTYDAIIRGQESALQECNKNVKQPQVQPQLSKKQQKKRDKKAARAAALASSGESAAVTYSTPVKNESTNDLVSLVNEVGDEEESASFVHASCPVDIDETVSSIASPKETQDLLWI